MSIETLAILSTLFLTILGWMVTAYYQKKILEHQLTSEKNRDAKMLIVPERVKRLNKISNWVEEGTELVLVSLAGLSADLHDGEGIYKKSPDLDSRFNKWIAESSKYSAFATTMEVIYKPTNVKINKLMEELCRSTTDFVSLKVGDDFSDVVEKKLNHLYLSSEIIIRIDHIIELCATKDIDQKNF